MCEACENAVNVAPSAGRRRIWDLAGGWHCAVIGTCLTLADLRALARKLKVQTVPGFSPDYQLHGFFVKEAENSGKPSKMLNKLLERRHAISIRRAKSMKTTDELTNFWQEALDTGEIPGPYWAILSHPSAPTELCERMFADVHMLSHLVGASNRADIRRLQDMEEAVDRLNAQLARQRQHHHRKLTEKDIMIAELQNKLCTERESPNPTRDVPIKFDSDAMIAELRHENAHLSALNADTQTSHDYAKMKIEELESLIHSLRVENTTLAETLVDEALSKKEKCPMNLGGLCLLYVGGHQHTVHRLRALVEDWNGRFLHHDGGVERSINELASAVTKADAVVFPPDCISHSAANKVKRLCHQNMKPFVPLRTSGVASFVAGIRDGLDDHVAGAELSASG